MTMTQEEKSLLLKDLCARLPYKVIVDYGYNAFDVHKGNYIKHGWRNILNCHLLDVFMSPRQNEKGEYIKPYLRPMSSMTEEEKKEAKENGCIIYWDTSPEDKGLMVIASPKGFDWLNKKMFDYRKDDEGKTMIEKGLAFEASNGMYNLNEK